MDWLFGAYMFRRLFRSLKGVICLLIVLLIIMIAAAWVFAPDLLEQFVRSVMGRCI